MISKSNCQKCGQTFEFDFSEFQESGRTATHIFGQTINCPSCGKATALTVKAPKISEPTIAESYETIEVNKHKSSGTVTDIVSAILVLIGFALIIEGFTGEFHEVDGDHGSAIRQTVNAIRYCTGFVILALGFILSTLNGIRHRD
jgi:transcription elongation factor Elf1